MAWLQTDPSGNIHLSFRFGGKKFKRSLKTQEQSKAEGRLHRLVENIRLVESGRLELPANADVATFLLSDGRLDGTPKVARSVNLNELFPTWDEISAQVDRGTLADADIEDLWDCLFLQRHEVDQLLEFVRTAATHPFIYPMVFTAAHTGARRSELLASKLGDFDATHMTVREKKRVKGTRSTRRVPVSAKLRQVLDDWFAIHPGGNDTFCMTAIPHSNAGRKGVAPISPDEAHDHFSRLLIGSQWEVIRGWHIFRHSFCSNCAMNGVDQRLIDGWVGHTSDEMRRRYRHLVPSHESEMLQKVFA